ncbi:hypothetical protein J6E39_01805 [bacterium]|nr:hypothetical protein [bacterium]
MTNKQVTNSNNGVEQNVTATEKLNSDVLKDTYEFNRIKEDDTPLDMVIKMIPFSERGIQLTSGDENLNQLFKQIFNSCTSELLPAVQNLTNFETLTDELKQAGDILGKIIDYIDEGFKLTDIPEEEEHLGKEFSEEHLLFAEMLEIADTEIRKYIPTPTIK